ncbi:MAG TPA: acyl-CoA desaturase [Cyanothece sp. UBA12306]|nr:acyl-CoA desaturase [Cyanothece sp. UBA12306]
MQLTRKKEPSLGSLKKKNITIKNDYLVKMQLRHLWLTNVIPLLGFLVLLGLIWQNGIHGLDIALLIGMYTLSLFGITVGFHRHFSHGAFETNQVIKVILAILGAMAAQSPLVYWVAQHRRHHAYSDLDGDPHSPHIHQGKLLGQLEGLWHGHVGWVLVPEATNTTLFARDLIQDPLIYKVSQLYFVWVLIGLLIPTVLGGVLTASWLGAFSGFLWGGLARIFLAQQTTFSINSICHIYGSRSFDTRENSTNNLWLAIPTVGEAWHNNHHAFPNSAKFGLQWWQVDLGYLVIRVLQLLGLAWDVKAPTAEMIEAKKVAQ